MVDPPPAGSALRGFASDNCSGVHPEVLAAIAAANFGHQYSYGADANSQRLQAIFQRHFGSAAQAFPVFNGTGANVVALQAMTTRWAAVVCSSVAHVNVDEGGAPESVGGLKLLAVPTDSGKLTPGLFDAALPRRDGVHQASPQVLSLTQSTELGTLYSVDELAALCDRAHRAGMTVHMDGARLCNAAATLDRPLRAITTDVGVDVLCFGGTKNGLLLGEVVVVLNPEAAPGLERARKTSMQLASKMRFISAQFDALLGTDLWLRNARHANAMAQRLATAVAELPGVTVQHEVDANAVFAVLPADAEAALRTRVSFSDWNTAGAAVRWMTSFDTTEDDVDHFVATLGEVLAGG
ncbi:threonine aldolase [Mycolicibacterium madagascariense]|nr:threonine aldolase [Mycolicibacterium madagascariense]